MVIYKTTGIVATHTMVTNGGVFLTSPFCVVLESSGSSNAVSSSLFVHVELGIRTGLVQLIVLSQQSTVSFKTCIL